MVSWPIRVKALPRTNVRTAIGDTKRSNVDHVGHSTNRCHPKEMAKKSKKAKTGNSLVLWHKTYIKRIRKRFGLSKH